MRRALSAAALAAVVGLAACDQALTEPNGPLTGTWSYRATGFQPYPWAPQVVCDLQSTYVFRQEGNEIEGRSSGGEQNCRVNGGALQRDSFPDGVVRGEIREGRVVLTNAGNWHSYGEDAGDRITGYLESYGEFTGQPMQTLRSGSFEMVKVSGDGYDGPRA